MKASATALYQPYAVLLGACLQCLRVCVNLRLPAESTTLL